MANVAGTDLLFKKHGLFVQGHPLEIDLPQTFLRKDQHRLVRAFRDVLDHISRQPTFTLIIIKPAIFA